MLLKLMAKEEWRIHSSLFGSFNFGAFPLVLALVSFLGSLSIPLFSMVMSSSSMASAAHFAFLLFGASVGGFGLLGKEAMNRRFGQASLLAYSSRSLPISERRIFFDFLIKDVAFYMALWIVPIFAGTALGITLLGIGINLAMLFSSLTLSFLVGLSLVFFLSTVYAHSSKIAAAVTFLIAVGIAYLADPAAVMPSLTYYNSGSQESLAISLLMIVVPSALSIIFIKVDYPQRQRHLKNSLVPVSKLLGTRYSRFVAKDFLDLHRSEGGAGKIIFSFLVPLGILWALLSMFTALLPQANFLIVFSFFLGLVSSTIYSWLTEFDIFSSYSFLPVSPSYVIKSKLVSYALLNSISLAALAVAAALAGEWAFFLPALVAFAFISLYSLSIVVYLTGLSPNIMLYSASVFIRYLLFISPVVIAMIFLSAWSPWSLLLAPILSPIPILLLMRSMHMWDQKQFSSF